MPERMDGGLAALKRILAGSLAIAGFSSRLPAAALAGDGRARGGSVPSAFETICAAIVRAPAAGVAAPSPGMVRVPALPPTSSTRESDRRQAVSDAQKLRVDDRPIAETASDKAILPSRDRIDGETSSRTRHLAPMDDERPVGGEPFRREAREAFVAASVETFTRKRLTRGPRAGNRDPAPVFIVGMPHAGADLCERILAAHPQVHGAGERTMLRQAFSRLGAGGDNAEAVRRIAALRPDTLDFVAATYLAGLRALAPGKARVVDRMPSNYLYLGLVALALPAARIIHCVRDPRDIGLAMIAASQDTKSQDTKSRDTKSRDADPDYADDSGDLGWVIGRQTRLMAHWKAAMPGAVLTLSSADWRDDRDGTLARVLTHLDLPPDPACAAGSEQPDIDGGWRTQAHALKPMIAELERAGALDGWDADPTR